jgi:hypothetical protein
MELTAGSDKYGHQFTITNADSALFEAWKGVQKVSD